MAGENNGQPPKPKGKPRGPGRPMPQNLRPPWKEGQSGNPGGRPRDAEHRQRARQVADELLDKIAKADPTYASGPGGGGTDIAGLVRAYEAVADRGGFLPVDRQAAMETAQGRMLLAALALQQLTPEQRGEILKLAGAALHVEQPPVLDVPTDSNK